MYKNIFSYLRCFLKYTRKDFHKNQCHAQLIQTKYDTNKHLQMLKPIMAPINWRMEKTTSLFNHKIIF
jgi:hypothetical protein